MHNLHGLFESSDPFILGFYRLGVERVSRLVLIVDQKPLVSPAGFTTLQRSVGRDRVFQFEVFQRQARTKTILLALQTPVRPQSNNSYTEENHQFNNN